RQAQFYSVEKCYYTQDQDFFPTRRSADLVLVDIVDEELEASTHNGSTTIGAYNGRRGSARTHNGDVTISATPASSGRLAARTHRSEEHTSELQSRENLVCRLLLEKKTN